MEGQAMKICTTIAGTPRLSGSSERVCAASRAAASAERVERARRLVESGFCDQPEVLEHALDRMIEREAAGSRHARRSA
jgi:hypothetical protein